MKTRWKKLSKKLLSGVLALAMMCSILPASAITAAAASSTMTIACVCTTVAQIQFTIT